MNRIPRSDSPGEHHKIVHRLLIANVASHTDRTYLEGLYDTYPVLFLDFIGPQPKDLEVNTTGTKIDRSPSC